MQLTLQSTNIDTVLEIYTDNRDGGAPTLLSQTTGEVTQVHVLTNGIYYARITQSITNAPLNQVYSVSISETNSPSDLDFIRAINWITFTNMPMGTTLVMDTNIFYPFNESIDWAITLSPGWHQFENTGSHRV
ncbi:MAG: hypothetical protein GKR87_16310 [Kiritimatiellae bacterium]|nr:hypothetical protein [Kiritimatiellia bacterium]